MPYNVALCLYVARPYFGPPWRCLRLNARYLARRAAGMLRLLPPLSPRRDFQRGLEVTLASIRRHATRVPPVVLLAPEPISPPPGIDEVIGIDRRPFESAACCHSSLGGLSAYFKIALFGLEGWDRIVYIDSDTLAVGDLSELWDPARFADKALYAVRETPAMAPHPQACGTLNTGVMVVNAALLDRRVHARMMELVREGGTHDCGDQGIVNAFLAGDPARYSVGELPEEFNVFVNPSIGERWPGLAERARILHFVGLSKPWYSDYDRDCPFGRQFKLLWEECARPPDESAPDETEGN